MNVLDAVIFKYTHSEAMKEKKVQRATSDGDESAYYSRS